MALSSRSSQLSRVVLRKRLTLQRQLLQEDVSASIYSRMWPDSSCEDEYLRVEKPDRLSRVDSAPEGCADIFECAGQNPLDSKHRSAEAANHTIGIGTPSPRKKLRKRDTESGELYVRQSHTQRGSCKAESSWCERAQPPSPDPQHPHTPPNFDLRTVDGFPSARIGASCVTRTRRASLRHICHIFRRSVGLDGGESSNLVSLASALFMSTTAVDIRAIFHRCTLGAAISAVR